MHCLVTVTTLSGQTDQTKTAAQTEMTEPTEIRQPGSSRTRGNHLVSLFSTSIVRNKLNIEIEAAFKDEVVQQTHLIFPENNSDKGLVHEGKPFHRLQL